MAMESRTPPPVALAPTLESVGDRETTTPGSGAGSHGTVAQPVRGSRIGNRYRIERLLGEGGMGAVYLAFDEVLEKEVALKFVRSDLAGGSAGLARLREEVRLAQKVTHRNVCRTYDLEEVDGLFLVKMEYVDGAVLSTLLRGAEGLPVDQVLRVAREVTSGLEAAHAQRVIHCDLKPHNILIEHGAGPGASPGAGGDRVPGGRVVLMDFGIARAAARTGQTTGRLGPMGTPEYMSPEQARGLTVDPRTDLYALGCVLYQCLVGEVPFPAESPMACALRHVTDPVPDPRARRKEIPPWLSAVIRRLLAKTPERRYPDAAAVREALSGPRPLPWRRGLGVGAAGAALLVAAVLSAMHFTAARARDATPWRAEISQKLPGYEENAEAPLLSPDGKWMAYMSDRDGDWRVYVEPAEGGPSRAVTPPGMSAIFPSWTSDGQQILFTTRDSRAYKVPVAGGAPTVVAEGAWSAVACGTHFVVNETSSPGCPTCPRLVLRGGEGAPAMEREVARLPPGEITVGFSCDAAGKQLVYAQTEGAQQTVISQHADLYVIDLEGAAPKPQRLTFDQKSNNRPIFTPDGSSVIFASLRDGSMNMWEIPTSGGAPVQLTTEGPALAGSVSRDGRLLYYDLDVTTVPLYAYSLEGGAGRRRIAHLPGDYSSSVPTPDGRRLVAKMVRDTRTFAVLVPLDGGEERILAEADAVSLSDDGRLLVLARDIPKGGSRLHVLPLAGGTERLVAEVPVRVRLLRCDAEGWIHASGLFGEGTWKVALAGGASERETEEPITRVLPAPRGGWRLAFVRATVNGRAGTPRMRVVAPGRPLDDPQAAQVLSTPLWDICVWMPDGESFLYWTGHEIRRRYVETGEERLVFTTGDVHGASVSPDGKTLYLAELTGHVRRQIITNFASRPRPRPQ